MADRRLMTPKWLRTPVGDANGVNMTRAQLVAVNFRTHENLKPTERFVCALLVNNIAGLREESQGWVKCGVSSLASDLGVSRSAVHNAMKFLVAADIVVPHPDNGGRRRRHGLAANAEQLVRELDRS